MSTLPRKALIPRCTLVVGAHNARGKTTIALLAAGLLAMDWATDAPPAYSQPPQPTEKGHAERWEKTFRTLAQR